MNHEALIDEAKELAGGKSANELAYWAFVYSYVSNHATRYLENELQGLKRALWTVGVPILLAIVSWPAGPGLFNYAQGGL